MKNRDQINPRIAAMAALAFGMWQDTHRCFIEHNLQLLSEVLGRENKLNDLQRELTAELVSLSRSSGDKNQKSRALIFADVVGDLELIGDYAKDILERVEIKIKEKLLFSEEAVAEYEELYHKTARALQEVVSALEDEDYSRISEVLKKQEHIDSLVDEYRRRHNQRMLDGVCSPMACNMFLNMLDFTAAVYYHAKKISRNLAKIKKL